ncbi:hypothetical protein [Gordonia terrae]
MLKPGQRLRSQVCTTEVIVVRPADVDLFCGGHPMVDLDTEVTDPGIDPTAAEGTVIGKRYTDSAGALEVLVTKAGNGSLATAAELLVLKAAPPLPSSD